MPVPAYPPELHAEAIAIAKQEGVQRAHEKTGVTTRTIQRWVKAAGIDLPTLTMESTERNRRAVKARWARHEVERTEQLALVDKRFLKSLHNVTEIENGLLELAAKIVKQYATTNASNTVEPRERDLRDLAQAFSQFTQGRARIVHDMQLLTGKPTERTEQEISQLLEAVLEVLKSVLEEFVGPERALEAQGRFAERLRLVQGGQESGKAA